MAVCFFIAVKRDEVERRFAQWSENSVNRRVELELMLLMNETRFIEKIIVPHVPLLRICLLSR